ncbi:hypothetical protein SPHV1_50064 [Novosphingobium sp. KN65.2]|nr:hypothetical protein SPHV1_50064 [Novosphingobium sp. KN65.2]
MKNHWRYGTFWKPCRPRGQFQITSNFPVLTVNSDACRRAGTGLGSLVSAVHMQMAVCVPMRSIDGIRDYTLAIQK